MTFADFEQENKLSFKNKDLLQQAFIHRSYLNENRHKGLEHNERLEFLGDAVLELAVTDFLYHKYPQTAEGDLTAYRSALVNYVMMAEVAQSLGVNDLMLLSKGESRDTGRARQVILADAMEAIIGAIYLDSGYETAEQFVAKLLYSKIDEVVKNKLWLDSKTRLQEQAQERVSITPSYKILQEVGPDHDKKFIVGVYLKDELVAEGEGKSKQEAEQEAAKKALVVKGW